MEPRYPKYMSDEERLEHAVALLEEAYSALCWIGTGADPDSVIVVRPARVQKAILRLDKTITALEKHRDEAL